MPISVQCSECHKKLKARDEMAGKRVKCPVCGKSLEIPSLAVSQQPAKAPPPLPLASQGARVAADTDAVIVRELTRLSHCHEAVTAAEKFGRDPSTAIGAGCGVGCATLFAVGIVLGLVLGTPAPDKNAARGGVLVLAGAVGGVIAFFAARRQRILRGSAKSEEALRLLEEAVTKIMAQFPHVVEAVGGAACLREATTVADVLRQRSGVGAPEEERSPQSALTYFECSRPSGAGTCSDDSCPCPGATIAHGTGYLYISEEVIEFRKDAITESAAVAKIQDVQRKIRAVIFNPVLLASPILMCKMGAEKRGIDLAWASRDAQHWWKTGRVPLRPTPMAAPVPREPQANRKPGSKVPRTGTYKCIYCGPDGMGASLLQRTMKIMGLPYTPPPSARKKPPSTFFHEGDTFPSCPNCKADPSGSDPTGWSLVSEKRRN